MRLEDIETPDLDGDEVDEILEAAGPLPERACEIDVLDWLDSVAHGIQDLEPTIRERARTRHRIARPLLGVRIVAEVRWARSFRKPGTHIVVTGTCGVVVSVP